MKPDQITPEDLNTLAIQKIQLENAQIKFENFTMKLFIKYGMNVDDSIGPDGQIVKKMVEDHE